MTIKEIDIFSNNFRKINELDALYAHLTSLYHNLDFSDLLRYQIVFAVSALDKYIHDLVRTKMIDIFEGRRTSTASFDSFKITFATYSKILSSELGYPPSYWIEREIMLLHKKESFQSPDNISNALSLIISTQHKWQLISNKMSINESVAKNTLKAIIDRRNAIVHEGDINPETGEQYAISRADSNNASSFVFNLVHTIDEIVCL